MDEWNEVIANLNTNEEKTLLSNCHLSEVDDPHGHLKGIFSSDAMSLFERPGIPPHELTLKVSKMKFESEQLIICEVNLLLLGGRCVHDYAKSHNQRWIDEQFASEDCSHFASCGDCTADYLSI